MLDDKSLGGCLNSFIAYWFADVDSAGFRLEDRRCTPQTALSSELSSSRCADAAVVVTLSHMFLQSAVMFIAIMLFVNRVIVDSSLLLYAYNSTEEIKILFSKCSSVYNYTSVKVTN